MNSFIIIFLVVGILLVSYITTKSYMRLKKKEKVFSSIKSIRDVLQLDIENFKDYILWLLSMNDYSVTNGKVIDEHEVIIGAKKDNKKQNIIVYKRAPNHLVNMEDFEGFKEKYLEKGGYGMLVTTSDFDDNVKRVKQANNSIHLISNIDLQKLMNKKKVEDPF